MGVCASSDRGNHASLWESDLSILTQKMKLLQQEIGAILKQRGEDTEVYERELMVFAFREAEWKKERKKLREEVKRLRKSLEEKEEMIKFMVAEFYGGSVGNDEKSERQLVGDGGSSSSIEPKATSMTLVERMREERARRDDAVEKWKMLYLAIKHELDDLIKRTHEGTLYWKAGGDLMMEELKQEVKAKDETIEALKAKIVSMEDEDYKRRREVDILRQSLRIVSSNNNTNKSAGHVKYLSKPSTRFTKNLSKLAFVK